MVFGLNGADAETTAANAPTQQSLRLEAPTGDGYVLRLTAHTTDADPTTCSANVGPIRLDAGATARVQVLSWQCTGVVGYVPASVAGDCFWLADWLLISRTSAAVGDEIALRASAHADPGKVPRFSWSSSAAAPGSFADARIASTSFRCQAAIKDLPLDLAVSDGECVQRLTQPVSCTPAAQ